MDTNVGYLSFHGYLFFPPHSIPCHDCQACQVYSMGLVQYAQHIAAAQHHINLKSLIFENVKPVSLHKILNRETIKGILQRNKNLKNQR